MPNIETYFDEIDLARIRRVKELSEIKRQFATSVDSDPLGVQSKAVVVLSYASWEGFHNDCVMTYHKFLSEQRVKVVDAGWFMLVGALSSDFESLRSRNHSRDAKRDFVEMLKERLKCEFDQFDVSTIQARLNLNFERLSSNYTVLGFDLGVFQKYRLRIDKEVVGWRHGVAHGNAPNLDRLDVANHIELIADLLALIADHFQEGMLQRV